MNQCPVCAVNLGIIDFLMMLALGLHRHRQPRLLFLRRLDLIAVATVASRVLHVVVVVDELIDGGYHVEIAFQGM